MIDLGAQAEFGSVYSIMEDSLGYQLKWITGYLAIGYAPMSYAGLKLIKTKGIDAIVNLLR